MNLVLFVTKANREDLANFCLETAELQKESPGGAIGVLHDSSIPVSVIAELIQPIRHLFPANVVLPVPINSQISDDGQTATMMAMFITQIYGKYPGEWLVVDGKAHPTVENFISQMSRLHKMYGKQASGRHIQEGRAIIPVGPMVLSMRAKDMRTLASCTGESWRTRGKWLFCNYGFSNIPIEDYPFSLVGGASTKVTEQSARKESVVEAKEIKIPVIGADPSDYEKMSREQLSQMYFQRTGKKPHHKLRPENLIVSLRELDAQTV